MRVKYSNNPEVDLFATLCEKIIIYKSQKIIIFLSGGSLIKIYEYFVEKFDSFISLAKSVGVTDFSNITFTLADERFFTDKENSNINFNQISATGFFDKFKTVGAQVREINSIEFEKSAEKFNSFLEKNLDKSKCILIAGIGNDGHTCSIFPQSDLAIFNSEYPEDKLAVAVEVDNQFSQRISITPFFITKMSDVFVFATGEEKKKVLAKLFYKEETEKYLFPTLIFSEVNAEVYTNIVF